MGTSCIKILPDRRIIIGTFDGKIIILCPEKNSCNYFLDVTLEGHTQGGHTQGRSTEINELLILSGGQIMVSASNDYTLKIWDIYNKIELMTLEGHTWPVTCVAELPDKRIISGSSDCTLKIWNLMCCDNTQRC